MKGKQRRVKEDFATIPQAPRYEINSFGVLRNRDTGYILKWQVHKHGHKFMALKVGGKKVGVSQCSLLWLLHGKIKAKTQPIATVINKGTRTLRFDSLKQCALFLEKTTSLTFGSIWYRLMRRHVKIADWDIRYLKS